MQAELAGYRGAFLSVIWVAGLVFVHRLAHAAASVVSSPSAHPYRQTLVGILIALLMFTVAESCGAIAKAYGCDQPRRATAPISAWIIGAGKPRKSITERSPPRPAYPVAARAGQSLTWTRRHSLR